MYRTILCLLLLALPARAVSVVGPISGADFTNPAAPVLLSGLSTGNPTSTAFLVYQVDGTGAAIPATGIFCFQGVLYPTGYAFASSYLTLAKNLNL